uniref:HORMA domain-containing protein n=1 Tax=Trichuris muris TaxID=70415 RepID=A0A5S6Q0I4_TRIMR
MEALPPEANNQAESIFYMKTLIAVVISNICYYRNLFPADVYEDYEFEGMKLKVLVGRRKSATQLIQCMSGCYESIDKRYLRQIMFGICDNCEYPEILSDCYTFTINYTDGGPAALQFETSSDARPLLSTKRSTLRMLQTIRMLCKCLRPLPRQAGITLKLVYYDERTPSDYEPPGFMPAESERFNYRNEPDLFNVGKVATPFHALHLSLKSASCTICNACCHGTAFTVDLQQH